VLTTHYIEEAEKLADRIGILHKGELLLVESRESLLQRHGGRSLEEIYLELIRTADGRNAA
jgi:ABC-2 type transport system ATP-binding protein